MSRRTVPLLGYGNDGTSQRERSLPALDPASVRIDERGTRDLLAFVQALSEQIRYYGVDAEGPIDAGDFAALARTSEVSLDDVAAYIADPASFEGERARWLGRPHFGLLLSFLELLGVARDQLNGLVGRHLDYFYRDLLGMRLSGPVADQAAVVFGLAPRTASVRVARGRELQAGRDSKGLPLIYRSTRDIVINQAQVKSLRSVFVDRRITGLADVRKNHDLKAPEVLDAMLALALGVPRPGDAIPPFRGQLVNTAFFAQLGNALAFTRNSLYLEHEELRSLMRLVNRRASADAEWNEINRLLGVQNPANPRDFAANLKARVGVLDFQHDGFPQIESIDDLYAHRTDPATETSPSIRDYIGNRLKALGNGNPGVAYDRFVALMPIKLRIDAEWNEVNRLLERAGRRKRGLLSFTLAPQVASDFAANLLLAIGPLPSAWPLGAHSITEYEAAVRALEAQLSMSVERLSTLATFAADVTAKNDTQAHDFRDVDSILADAHREQFHARRRSKLADVRAGLSDGAALTAVANFVLGSPTPALSFSDALARLASVLDRAQIDALSGFNARFGDVSTPATFDWSAAYRLLELAQTRLEDVAEPVAERSEWHNLYAYDDATQVLADPERSTRFRLFGGLPRDPNQRGATVGWAMRSPLLALSSGKRTLTLTFGFQPAGFDRPGLLAALGLGPLEPSKDALRQAFVDTLRVSVSTAKSFIDLSIQDVTLVSGAQGADYWSLLGQPRPGQDDRPALQLVVAAPVSQPAFAPLEATKDAWPTLRVTFVQKQNDKTKEWTSRFGAFESFGLAATQVAVKVEGLSGLRLQSEDRALDARKPFEPFGARPALGSRFYVTHPELVRLPLESLTFGLEWMGLPKSLLQQYANYGIKDTDAFKVSVSLIDAGQELSLGSVPLFKKIDGSDETPSTQSSSFTGISAAFGQGYAALRRLAPQSDDDLRLHERYLAWELASSDFGHARYPALSAAKARELAIALSTPQKDPLVADNYRVDPPYTPNLKRLTVSYTRSLELTPSDLKEGDALLHVHPFGSTRIDAADPTFLPRYACAGEFYLGLSSVNAPEHVTLLMQLAEGTSDPDVQYATPAWSYLDGDEFQPLQGLAIVADETRGLINAGIIELALPAAAEPTRLPADSYWLRVAVPRDPASVCDAVGIHAQAVSVMFDDRGNDASHYAEPLPPASINRLVDPEPGIVSVAQPYSSFGGRSPERADNFQVRVSERLRHKQRAIAPWDYERLVLQQFPQIYRAKCLPAAALRDPYHALDVPIGSVDIIVIPDIRDRLPSDVLAPKASSELLADVRRFLSERMPGDAVLRVRNARYVGVKLRVAVRFAADQDESNARARLDRDLVRFLSPWAFDEGADLTIGGRIYANDLVNVIDRLEYVDYVANIKLFRVVDGLSTPVPPTATDYHISASHPDEVLVSAPHHDLDVISGDGYEQSSLTGVNYMRIELDFIVA